MNNNKSDIEKCLHYWGKSRPLLSATLLARIDPERKLKLHANALEKLGAYNFPGNIRELRNILERASLMADGDAIMPEHLSMEYNQSLPIEHRISKDIIPLEKAEQQYLQWAVSKFEGDRNTLAKKLGISERTLYRKLQN